MTLYSPQIVLDFPTQKKKINDYEITLTIKNSILNIFVNHTNDFKYYESNFGENELQQKFHSTFTIKDIFDDICNLIDKKNVQIEENKLNIKLIFSSIDLYTELIIDISLKQLHEIMKQLIYKSSLKDYTIISLFILVLFCNIILFSIYIINNNNNLFKKTEDNNIKFINTKINEWSEKKMLEINKTIINSINDEIQKSKINQLTNNLDISQINDLIHSKANELINIEITEINNAIDELNKTKITEINNAIDELNKTKITEINNAIDELNNSKIAKNQILELKENIVNETNNTIEQFYEIINTKINSLNYDYTITTLTNIKTNENCAKQINSMAIFPSKEIVFVSDDYSITLLDKDLNFINKKSNVHNTIIYDISIFDENNFVTCSKDLTIKTWNKYGEEISLKNSITDAHKSTILKVIYNSKGNIISGSFDNTIKIWELNNRIYTNTILLNHRDKVYSLLLLEDKNILISAGIGIKFWNLTNNEIILSNDNIKTIWNSGIEKINNDTIIVCNENNSFIIYSISELKIIKEIQIDYYCFSIKSIPNKNIFFIGSIKDIYIYRSDNYKLIQIINIHNKRISKINEFTDNSVITTSFDKTIKSWFLKTIYVERISDFMN